MTIAINATAVTGDEPSTMQAAPLSQIPEKSNNMHKTNLGDLLVETVMELLVKDHKVVDLFADLALCPLLLAGHLDELFLKERKRTKRMECYEFLIFHTQP